MVVIGSSPICPANWRVNPRGLGTILLRCVCCKAFVSTTMPSALSRCSTVGSMPDLGSGGRKFESCHLDWLFCLVCVGGEA